MNPKLRALLLAALATVVLLGYWAWVRRMAPPYRTLALADAPAALAPRYLFSGVTDDGAQGAGTRKEATSVLCTNTGAADNTILVELYQWSGALVYTGTVTAAPMASFTFSTQNTSIYFDDIIFGTGGGTASIFQGSGRILSSRPQVICTAEVLDPLGYPPVYMDRLTMYRADGRLVGSSRRLFLPVVR